MSHIIINGGKKLHGTVVNQPNKNSALAILCASLMVKGATVLRDVPEIDEVGKMLRLLASIGARVERQGTTVTIDASAPLSMEAVDREACQIRASLLLVGALCARLAAPYRLYKTGGCRLGERTVRPHWYALQKFGLQISSQEAFYQITNPAVLQGAPVVMYESGDAATENAILAAVLARGTTTLKMASANYMVQDLCYFLREAGAQIEGIGTTTLQITGVPELRPVAGYHIMPDPIAAMTFLSAAITTGSELTVAGCPLDFLELELCKLEVMGQEYRLTNRRQSANGQFALADITMIPGPLTALPDKIYGRPFPGLNIDNLPLFVPILTQAQGRTLVHDWVYEKRSIYFLELQKLGCHIELLDPHRLWVEGPTEMSGNEIVCPPALRPAASFLICMLAAKGRSVLRQADVIGRGYEQIDERLRQVGADIEVVR